MTTVEEQKLDVVKIDDEFTIEWLNNICRSHHMFGGLQDQLIPARNGYVLPNELQRVLEPYILYRYKTQAGDQPILETHESYDIDVIRGVVTLEGEALIEAN